MERRGVPMSRLAIPALLERKKSFLIAAFDELPEFEAGLDQNDTFVSHFTMLVNALEGYPTGICTAPNKAKVLIYCADAMVSASLAVLLHGDMTADDFVCIGEMLESALGNICSSETHYEQ